MKGKTVYLHIGSPKTGTSALQYFLLKNRQALAEKGIAYPEHPLDDNGVSSGNAEQFVRAIKAGDSRKIRQFIDETLNEDCSKIILSSEYFYRLAPEEVADVRRSFSQVETKIIAYLRRQDFVLVSAFNQGVKRAHRKYKMATWCKIRVEKQRADYEQLFKWARFFGKENLIVRVYEEQQYTGGNIFCDFLDSVGLDFGIEFDVPQKRINTAYRIDALEVKRLLNFLPTTENITQLDTFLQSYSDCFGKEWDWPYVLLSPAERLDIIAHYADSSAAIAREYLGRQDGRLFYDPLPDCNEPWQPYPGLSADDVHRIATFIIERDVNTAQQIGRAIKQALQSDDRDVQAAAKILSGGLDIFLSKRASLRDHAGHCGARCRSGMRRVYHKMPVKLQKPIAAVARKLKII